MAAGSGSKARKKRKKLFARVFTIIIVSVMAGSILLATLLSPFW